MKFAITSALCLTAFAGAVLADVDPIVIKGNKFFYKTNGTQFIIKGVAYQEDTSRNGSTDEVPRDFVDPLADGAACKRDIPYLKQLGTNAIRVYAIDPKQNHDECMKLFQEAGIYVVSDLSEPKTSINRDSPAWNEALYERYTSVVDELQQYNNVLGFFAGNEVTNNKTNTNASPFVKAAVRDVKAYIKEKGYRQIPVGYATNDDSNIRVPIAEYFNCDNEDSAIDFWGYNIYSWCGNSSFTESGYDKRTEEFETYSKPAFFAEYGCNQPRPREFGDVQSLYGKDMIDVWSGGIVYMYLEEANEFGLVNITGNNVTPNDDFKNLKNQLSKVKPTTVKASDYTPVNTALSTCPTSSVNWKASSKLPPTPNKDLCSCMVKSLTCVAKSSVSTKKIPTHFSYICGEGNTDCSGISADGEAGEYGAYSACSPVEQLSWAMNEYWNTHGQAADACDFGGDATKQSPTKATGTCSTLIQEAESGASTSSSSSSKKDKEESAAVSINTPIFGVLAAVFVGFAAVFA